MSMRRALAGLLVVASVSHDAIAAAEGTQRGTEDGLSGLQAELGIGVALPAGDVGDNWGKLSDATVFAVPMDINLGYRLSERLGIGAYFLIAPAFPGQDLALCDGADHCRAIMVRLGVHAQYHFAPRAGIDPWLGLGAGWEVSTVTAAVEPTVGGEELQSSFGYNGPVLADARLGVDFGIPEAGWGPYVGLAVGRFQKVRASCDLCMPESVSDSIDEQAFHVWLSLGVQGRLVWAN